MQVIGHRGKSRGDYPANIFPLVIDDIECNGRPKINDDQWAPEFIQACACICQAIGANR